MSTATTSSRSNPRRRHRSSAAAPVKHSLAYTLLLGVLLIGALGLLITGARMSLAGIAGYQAEAFISDWAKTGAEPESRAWQVAHDAAQRAVDVYPVADGDALDRLGRVYSWQQFRQPYADPGAADSRRAALHAYRASVAARPVWPYSWARLAHAKRYLQQFDDEFEHALTRAFQRGPWRLDVNRELVDIGFGAWAQLSPAQRQATRESARRVSANGPAQTRYIDGLAKKHGVAL